MIHAITANKPSFNAVHFDEGLNLVVARRDSTAGAKGTRNSLGKTTLLHIIDFIFGSEPDRHDTLRTDVLPGWAFSMEATLRGNRVFITRKTDEPKCVYVRRTDGKPLTWPQWTDFLPLDGAVNYTISDWRDMLGWLLFDLPLEHVDLTKRNAFKPQAPDLIHYFLRLGYEREMVPFPAVGGRWELSVAYLMGLDWQYLRQINELDYRKRDVDVVNRAAQLKMAEMNRTKRALEVECVELESRIKTLSHDIENFSLQQSYADAENEVNECRAQINKLRAKIRVNELRYSSMIDSLKEAKRTSESVRKIYEETQLTLPDSVCKTIDEVQAFHQNVYVNRREFLEGGVRKLKEEIETDKKELSLLRNHLTKAEEAVTSKTALEEFARFNALLSDAKIALADKRRCLDDMLKSEHELARIVEGKNLAAQEARESFARIEPIRENAERSFKRITHLLYGAEGSLNMALSSNRGRYGYTFNPSIPYDRSSGIRDIRIFSFDLTLYLQQCICSRGIDFLIHDSTIFDSADPRQVAQALKEADHVTREHHGQYICMLNSHMLEGPDFESVYSRKEVESHIKLALDDSSPAHSLLGFRYT